MSELSVIGMLQNLTNSNPLRYMAICSKNEKVDFEPMILVLFNDAEDCNSFYWVVFIFLAHSLDW